jgi:hypothetical protein
MIPLAIIHSLIANLLVLVVLIIGWYVLTAWRHSRYLFFLALYLFLIIGSLVGYLAVLYLSKGLVIGSIAILIVLFCWPWAARKIKLPKNNRFWFSIFIIVALISAVASSVGIYYWRNYQANQQYILIDKNINQQIDQLGNQEQQAKTQILGISHDQQLASALANKDRPALNKLLTNEYQNRGLSFLILTDNQGTVLMRLHYPQLLGDDLFQTLPWTTQVKNSNFQAINNDEQGSPVIAAAISWKLSSGDLYYLIGGYELNQDYLRANFQDPSSGILLKEGNYLSSYSSNPKIKMVLDSQSLTQYLNTQTQANPRLIIQTPTTNYQLASQQYGKIKLIIVHYENAR